MSDAPTLRVERDGGLARLVLARPQVRNAFNARMIADLTAACGQLAADADLRAVVLSGEGKVFCAGADVSWMRDSAAATQAENRDDARRMAAMFRALDELPVPVVARVQRAAFGGGVGLIACCDVIVAADDARFSFSEVKLGILPAVISTFALRKIGPGQARRWFLTGETFDAARAREIGLVHEVVAEDRLDAAVQEVVDVLLANGPRAMREAKALIRRLAGFGDPAAAVEHCAETIARVRVSPEAQEGLRAFLEKRHPAWRASRSAGG